MHNVIAVADRFQHQGAIVNIQEYGKGNINNTFLVTLENSVEKHFILQRINTKVFAHPELVMKNICFLSDRVRQKLANNLDNNCCDWQIPYVLKTNSNRNYYLDSGGDFWRAISFIENADSCDLIQDLDRANEIGYALGTFHNLISDLPTDKLADTLVGFHITPNYLRHYRVVLAKSKPKISPEVDYCLKFIEKRADGVDSLEQAKAQGKLQLRAIHGDPKINNIMIDRTSKKAIAMVDLDTVKPGLVHYDIGDCLRSGCNLLGEETDAWENVNFELDYAQAILQGYLTVAHNFLTAYDYQYLYEGIRLITFELGLRFFTDYLEGNIYFKTKYLEHNLMRALVQFKLTESIESQKVEILNIIRSLV